MIPSVRLIYGDSLRELNRMNNDSIDSMVTDPPAGISFMGRGWDSDRGGSEEWISYMGEIFGQAFYILKPGAYALVWALPRTSHWTGAALERAGFEIRDVVVHLYGQGFPKSHNLDGDWKGWGTALKPASEHWILCRKPLGEKTVAANVQKYGTGALNIDGCRVSVDPIADKGQIRTMQRSQKGDSQEWGMNKGASDTPQVLKPEGRWPADVVLSHTEHCVLVGTKDGKGYQINRWEDGAKPFGGGAGHPYKSEEKSESVEIWACVPECPVRMLDQQSGILKSGAFSKGMIQKARGPKSKGAEAQRVRDARKPDSGGASRFFYCAKPNRKERNMGLEGRERQEAQWSKGSKNPGAFQNGSGRFKAMENHHPTVKAISLLRYFCRLITPPGGVVLDCFMGSGSTGIAAQREGFGFIGIEREQEYFEIAKARIWASQKEVVGV